jgi:hypothetical protein
VPNSLSFFDDQNTAPNVIGQALRIPAIVTTCSDGSRPPVPIDRDQFDGAVRCIF